jgi:hypothetical protein
LAPLLALGWVERLTHCRQQYFLLALVWVERLTHYQQQHPLLAVLKFAAAAAVMA